MQKALLDTTSSRSPLAGNSEGQPDGNPNSARILVLTSSLLTDRMLCYSPVLDHLAASAQVDVWATSFGQPGLQDIWRKAPAAVAAFPEVRPFRQRYNYLRRMNEFAWDYRLKPPSRLSARKYEFNPNYSARIHALKGPARLVALLRQERRLERWLEQVLLRQRRSPEADARLDTEPYDLLLTTSPFWFTEPAVVAAARQRGIPVLALIPSWDNLSTKNRLVFNYDGYLVWSEEAQEELHHFYPESRAVPSYVVGAPQYDVFHETAYHQRREDYCAALGLRADQPIILYAIGSPNFLKGEIYGALHLAEQIKAGHLGDVQMVVRPHPVHDKGEVQARFAAYADHVVVQTPAAGGDTPLGRSQTTTQVVDWINTFRHADVVVNLSSTVTIDAALFDTPVVNLDYDPAPGQPQQAIIKDINHRWTHFKPVAESGGVWLVNDQEAMVEAVQGYLSDPSLHQERRRWMASYVCGFVDGRCGERMAAAVLDFVQHQIVRDDIVPHHVAEAP